MSEGEEHEYRASSWLVQQLDNAPCCANGKAPFMHVVWGQPSVSHSQSSENDLATHKTGHRRYPPLPRDTRCTDSSETPRLVLDEPESENLSPSRSNIRSPSADVGHILFPDESTSDMSEGYGRPYSWAAAMEDAPPPCSDADEVATRDPPLSRGSLLHDTGRCKPCLFEHTVVGCSSGASCSFCHFPHSRKQGPRPCKSKRERFKAIVERQAREAGIENHHEDGHFASVPKDAGITCERRPGRLRL
mmetsp:Transcript_85626/g.167529  ORF Transcript_85626/g.167529 Transcript_85626/m.167529 type:complete len:247 (-) Transcript_85626:372-1112(-)